MFEKYSFLNNSSTVNNKNNPTNFKADFKASFNPLTEINSNEGFKRKIINIKKTKKNCLCQTSYNSNQ